MKHYESRIKINGEWRTLLVVKSDIPEDFNNSISFEVGERTIIYYTEGIYRQFEKAGEYIYWFLPSYKESIITQDATAREDISDLENQMTDTQLALCDTYEQNIALGDELTNTQLALCDTYEQNLALSEKNAELEQQLTDTQLALCDVYELVLGGEY